MSLHTWGSVVFTTILLFFSTAHSSADLALYSDPTWRALLHLNGSSFLVPDSRFYLTRENRTAQSELEAFQSALASPMGMQTACQFPARYFWLRSKTQLPEYPLERCRDLNEFRMRAPAGSVSLVFASENVSQPSSMMGHVFIKIAGQNSSGINVAHSVSFFTDLRDWNVPKLIVQSLITGKRGYYSLAPYDETRNYYQFEEHRNLWEYVLNFSDFEKTLFQYALFELKGVVLEYHYLSFNCATMVMDVIGIVRPGILDERGLWVTPLDVVRASEKNKISNEQTVTASSRWRIKAILESKPPSAVIQNLVRDQSYQALLASEQTPENKVFSFELALAYNDFLFESEKLPKADWTANYRELRAGVANQAHDQSLDLAHYKKPSLTPKDSQAFMAWSQDDSRRLIKIGFLPTSHDLMDDNSQYQNESELKLGELIMQGDVDTGAIQLRSLNLYSAVSLQPSDRFTGGLSGRFQFGFGPRLGGDLVEERTFSIEGGLGKSYRLLRDVDFFAIAEFGVQSGSGAAALLSPNIGLLVREVGGMKSLIQAQAEIRDQTSPLLTVSVRQAFNRQDYGVHLRAWRSYHQANSSTGSDVGGMEIAVKAFF